jgi:hypothetical protein
VESAWWSKIGRCNLKIGRRRATNRGRRGVRARGADRGEGSNPRPLRRKGELETPTGSSNTELERTSASTKRLAGVKCRGWLTPLNSTVARSGWRG